MHQKPPLCDGRSHLFARKDSRSIGALKARAEELGLKPYAGLYGDKRYVATWLKLLENEPELQPLHPRQPEQSAPINWKLAIALFVGAMALLYLLQPLRSKVLPVHIDVNIRLGEQK